MGYLLYYLGWMALSYVAQDPRLLVGFLVLFVLQRFIPDPLVWLRLFRRSRALKAQIAMNRSNALARRDLARLYLDWRRPGSALALLDEALVKQPADAELHFLRGRALVSLDRNDDALSALGHALELDASVGHAEPYLLAGDAHARAGRTDEAIEAYEHYVNENHSHIEARRKLAEALAKAGDGAGASRARQDAIDTYAHLPSYMRRRQLGAYVRLRLGALLG